MISFVIPTLNEEKVIERTLRNVSEYSGPHEIIVSDGGSTDKTIEIARKYTHKVVQHKGTRSQTIAEGRNRGACIASGDFIVEIDADSYFPDINKFFSSIIQVFTKNQRVVGATTWFRVYPREETLFDQLVFKIIGGASLVLNNYLGLGCTCGGEFQIIRTEAFRQIGGYAEKLVAMEDVELFTRLAKIGRIHFERKLYIYHSGRRAHILGWPHSIVTFVINSFFLMAFGKVRSPVWGVVR